MSASAVTRAELAPEERKERVPYAVKSEDVGVPPPRPAARDAHNRHPVGAGAPRGKLRDPVVLAHDRDRPGGRVAGGQVEPAQELDGSRVAVRVERVPT